MSRYIPANVRRELRQEANFGCAICGIPIIEYHHIIPYSEKEHHNPNHMIALCPTHHRPSDDAAITREKLYDLKENPHNEDIVDYMFYYNTNLPELAVATSSVLFAEEGEGIIFRINGSEILTARYQDNRLNFDIKFYSKQDELIAEINNNDWWADTNEVWDLQYKSNIFKVYNSEEKLGLKVEHDPDTGLVSLIGKFQHGGDSLNVSRSRISVPSAKAIQSNIDHVIGGEDPDCVDSVKGRAAKFHWPFSEESDHVPVIYSIDDGECLLGPHLDNE